MLSTLHDTPSHRETPPLCARTHGSPERFTRRLEKSRPAATYHPAHPALSTQHEPASAIKHATPKREQHVIYATNLRARPPHTHTTTTTQNPMVHCAAEAARTLWAPRYSGQGRPAASPRLQEFFHAFAFDAFAGREREIEQPMLYSAPRRNYSAVSGYSCRCSAALLSILFCAEILLIYYKILLDTALSVLYKYYIYCI